MNRINKKYFVQREIDQIKQKHRSKNQVKGDGILNLLLGLLFLNFLIK